jgi:heat shock protein HtpX
MLIESLQVIAWFGIERFTSIHQTRFLLWNHFWFFDIDLALTIIGVVFALFAGVYVQFGRVRLNLAAAFPQMNFIESSTELKECVRKIAKIAGTATPEVFLVDSGALAAFSSRVNKKYVIAVTVGLLESLNAAEIEACVAHEIAHLKNNDFTLRLLATLAKVALFARPLSYLIEPAVYRAQEYMADSTAAKLIGGPEALASALSKLQDSVSIQASLTPRNAICLCNWPSKSRILRIFEKHPDLQNRINQLQHMKHSYNLSD